MNDAVAQFIDCMISHGVVPADPREIVPAPDGARFDVEGDKPGSQNGWFLLHVDGVPNGWFEHHRTQVKGKWIAKADNSLSDAEREALRTESELNRKKRLRAREERYEVGASKAAFIWSQAADAPADHPYLKRKGVQPHGVKVSRHGALIVPVKVNGKLSSIQFIPAEAGEKKIFLTDGRTKAGFFRIGPVPTDHVIVCEGFATGATLHEVTGIPVLVSFFADNIADVAAATRKQLPQARIIIAADNDMWTDGNPGLKAASSAAARCDGVWVKPTFPHDKLDTRPTDFNDLATLVSPDEVRHQIENGTPSFLSEPPVAATPGAEPTPSGLVRFIDWPDRNSKGDPLTTIDNLLALTRARRVRVRYNVITKEEEILHPEESFTPDNFANAGLAKLQSDAARAGLSCDRMTSYLTYLADKNQFNPVVEWIKFKSWDGVSRLADLYKTVVAVGEKVTTEGGNIRQMKETFILRWLISAVAGAFRPTGVSAHGVLVFQGPQSLGKTKWLRRLVPPELKALVLDGVTLRPDDRDSVKQAVSKWLVELGELDGTFKKSDIAMLKSFITRDTDVLRKPYAQRESTFARRTVFFASVNPKGFLVDTTGNRRFWTIECEYIDYEHTIDMQQLWAEVHVLYSQGVQWWLTEDEEQALRIHNEEFELNDPIEDRISTRLNWNAPRPLWGWTTATDVLVSIGIAKPTHFESTRASAVIFERNGGEKRRKTVGRELLVPPLKELF